MSQIHYKGEAFMWPASGDDLRVERFEAEGIMRDQPHELALDLAAVPPDDPERWSGVLPLAGSGMLRGSFKPRGDSWPGETQVNLYRATGNDSVLLLWGEWRERDPESHGAYDVYKFLVELDSEDE